MFTTILSSKLLLTTLFSILLLSPSATAKDNRIDNAYYACCTYKHDSLYDMFEYNINLPKFGNSDTQDANCESDGAGECGKVAYREINGHCSQVLDNAGDYLSFSGFPSYLAEHDTNVQFYIKKKDQKSSVDNVQMPACIAAALGLAAADDGLDVQFNCVQQDTNQPNTISYCQDVVGAVSVSLP